MPAVLKSDATNIDCLVSLIVCLAVEPEVFCC